MVVVADIRLEGSANMSVWTGDRALGVCAALCVCRRANVVEMGYILAPAAGGRQQRQEGGERAQERQRPHAWILVQINFIHVRAFL